MPKASMPILPLGEPILNERLFSNHFIKEVLPKKSFWLKDGEAQTSAFETLKKLRESRDDLGTRQLGSIYEGLLEYRPRVGEKYLAEKKKKGAVQYEPTTDAKKASYRPGQIYYELYGLTEEEMKVVEGEKE
jgi:hypothetical protein